MTFPGVATSTSAKTLMSGVVPRTGRLAEQSDEAPGTLFTFVNLLFSLILKETANTVTVKNTCCRHAVNTLFSEVSVFAPHLDNAKHARPNIQSSQSAEGRV